MKENRTAQRYAFGVEQHVAPIFAGEIPTLDSFLRVRCTDISSHGFAFYQETRPHFEELFVALGLPPNLIYLSAQVVHTELIEICGALAFRVGCRFTGWARRCEVTGHILRDADPDPQFAFLPDAPGGPSMSHFLAAGNEA
jgi:hypothetical protein